MVLQRNFSSPPLVRWLCDRRLAEAGSPPGDLAEQLSTWWGPFDAMTLHAAHQAMAVAPVSGVPGGGASPVVWREACDRLRAQLLEDATVHDAPAARGRRPGAQPPPAAMAEPEIEYAPYQRRHLQLQRQMETQVAALRAQLRQALSSASGRLRQLALLDAALEQSMEARSQKLLAGLPAYLERRFEQLYRARQQAPGATVPVHELAGRSLGGHWRSLFEQEWREVLASELDCRLQTVVGMIDALSEEVGKQA